MTASGETSFDDILGSVSFDDFVRESWGHAPRVIEGAADKYSHLFSWRDLNAVLEADVLRPPRIRLAQNGKSLPENQCLRAFKDTTSLNSAGITAAVRDGAVLILTGVDALFPPVRTVAESVEERFGAVCQINLYLGWKASKGFAVHWDRHDVTVLQVEGRKAWKVWKPTRLHPLAGDAAPEPTGEPDWQGMLEQGDTLYLPRGWWHCAEALDETSVHLTVGCRRSTASDFVRSMRERVAEAAPMRANLPLDVADLDSAVFDEIAAQSDSAALEHFLQNEASGVWTRPQFDLSGEPPAETKNIDGSTQVKLSWTRGLEFVALDNGKTRVITVGVTADCSNALVPFLRRLSGTEFTQIDTVRDGLDDRKSRRELAMLVTTLAMKNAVILR